MGAVGGIATDDDLSDRTRFSGGDGLGGHQTCAFI